MLENGKFKTFQRQEKILPFLIPNTFLIMLII
jgi:hypothetical protein